MSETLTATETSAEIAQLVDEGAKLHSDISKLEAKKERLDEIKVILRKAANGEDRTFKGTGAAVAMVEQKGKAMARVVDEERRPRVLTLAGERIFKLFTLHPSKGDQKSFEINAYKTLPKKAAAALLALLGGNATPWVRFG